MSSHRRGVLLSGTSSRRQRPPRDPPSHRPSRPRAPPTTRRGQRACLRLRTTLTCPSLAKTRCGALHRIALLVQSALSLLKQVLSSAASFGVHTISFKSLRQLACALLMQIQATMLVTYSTTEIDRYREARFLQWTFDRNREATGSERTAVERLCCILLREHRELEKPLAMCNSVQMAMCGR